MIFALLGRESPATRKELLAWIEDELVRDQRRPGRQLSADDLQRAYARAVQKFRRRRPFRAVSAGGQSRPERFGS
jgi:hypothetical protein